MKARRIFPRIPIQTRHMKSTTTERFLGPSMQTDHTDHKWHSWYSKDRVKFAFWKSMKISGVSLSFALVAAPFLYHAARHWPETGLLPVTPEAMAIGCIKSAAFLFPIYFLCGCLFGKHR